MQLRFYSHILVAVCMFQTAKNSGRLFVRCRSKLPMSMTACSHAKWDIILIVHLRVTPDSECSTQKSLNRLNFCFIPATRNASCARKHLNRIFCRTSKKRCNSDTRTQPLVSHTRNGTWIPCYAISTQRNDTRNDMCRTLGLSTE